MDESRDIQVAPPHYLGDMLLRFGSLRALALFLLWLSFPTVSLAQPRWQLGVEGLLGFPEGAFADNLDDTGYGLSAQLTYRLGETPFRIGGDFGWLRYGRQSRVEPFTPRVPEIGFEVSTNYDIFLGHFLARWDAAAAGDRLRPYLDGLIGVAYLATQSEVDSDVTFRPILTTTNFDDYAFSAGGGVGLQVRLSGDDPEKEGTFLDFRVQYLFGSEAEYLAEGGLTTRGDEVILDVKRSRTDLFLFSVGVLFDL